MFIEINMIFILYIEITFVITDMGKTIEELDEVIGYYLVTRELCDLIQAGPHTGSIESLNIYLEVCV